MKRHDPISRLMSAGALTVHVAEPISKARKLMRDCGLHHLPVVSGTEIVGILSFSDILRVSFGDAFGTDERTVDATLDHTMTVEQVMTKNPAVLKKDATVRDAAELLAEGKFHAVPIVESDGRTLAGMVTSTDLIRYLLQQM